MRSPCFIALSAVMPSILLLPGCATDLKAVRSFADETKKISVAFDPILARSLENCQLQRVYRMAYTAEGSLDEYDAQASLKMAEETCKSVAEENANAKAIAKSLADYASKLSAVAADGVPTSIDDDYEKLKEKVLKFDDVPKEKTGAISALFKFITKVSISGLQKKAINEALSHEEAVGALADALVIYTERVYAGYIDDRRRNQPAYVAALKMETGSPALTRLSLLELHRQTLELEEQAKATAAFKEAVAQMKKSMKELRSKLDRLKGSERVAEVQKLAEEVQALYEQLEKAL